MSEARTLRLTDDGVDTPDELVGRTGEVVVEKPEISMTFTFVNDGIQERDTNLLTFPPTDKEPVNVPNGHVKIDGQLYKVVDERSLNECPECGSDKIAVYDDPPKCYGCETELAADTEPGADGSVDGESE